MKVHFEDRDWQLDLSEIELKPAMVIQGYTGMSVNKWIDSLQDQENAGGEVTFVAADQPGFLTSIAAVYWLMLAQNGVACPIADVNFKVGAFTQAMADAQAAEAAEAAERAGAAGGAEPDPTPLPPASALSPVPASTPTPQTGASPDDSGFPGG